MSGRVQDKVVVVTGAARGQGRADGEHLAREGAQVWLTDVLDDEGAAVVADWTGRGALHYRHLDVSAESDWAALRDELQSRYGRVDALVNNAGVASRHRLPNVAVADFDACLAVNLTGPMIGIQTLVRLMPAGSSIVNIVSTAGLGGVLSAPYTISKWGLRGLTRVASLEFGDRGIRVNAILPGLIDTPINAQASREFLDAVIQDTPLGRLGTVDEIAPLVVYLVSDESSYVSGAEITVDGGMTGHVSSKRIGDVAKAGASQNA